MVTKVTKVIVMSRDNIAITNTFFIFMKFTKLKKNLQKKFEQKLERKC
jgi:hypothetical protein